MEEGFEKLDFSSDKDYFVSAYKGGMYRFSSKYFRLLAEMGFKSFSVYENIEKGTVGIQYFKDINSGDFKVRIAFRNRGLTNALCLEVRKYTIHIETSDWHVFSKR